MALLGFGLDAIGDDSGNPPSEVFHTYRRGVRGLGVYNASEGAFDVLPGSEIDIRVVAGTPKHPNQKLEELRSKLLEAEDLVADENGIYRLGRTLHFDSPSAAAVFVLGGSCNGWAEWVNEEGVSLSRVYREE